MITQLMNRLSEMSTEPIEKESKEKMELFDFYTWRLRQFQKSYGYSFVFPQWMDMHLFPRYSFFYRYPRSYYCWSPFIEERNLEEIDVTRKEGKNYRIALSLFLYRL